MATQAWNCPIRVFRPVIFNTLQGKMIPDAIRHNQKDKKTCLKQGDAGNIFCNYTKREPQA